MGGVCLIQSECTCLGRVPNKSETPKLVVNKGLAEGRGEGNGTPLQYFPGECLWSYKGRTRLSDCTTTTTTEGEEGRGIPHHLTSETCKGLSQGTRRQNATGAVRCLPRAPAAGKGRFGAGVRQVRGREGGATGAWGPGRVSACFETVSPERKAGFWKKGLQRWKQRRANSQRNNISFSKMQRTTVSGSLATGRSQHLMIKLETQV